MGAYLRAIDEGVDGLECDVRLTRDGHLVCIHDSRLERTSDGRGRVSAATLDELERLDFGSWHKATQHADYPHTQSPLTQSPLIQSPLTKSPHTARVGRRSLTGRRYRRRRRDIDVVLPVAGRTMNPGRTTP